MPARRQFVLRVLSSFGPARDRFFESSLHLLSKSAVQLNVCEIRVRAGRKKTLHNAFAGSMCDIQREGRLSIELIVRTQIKYGHKSLLTAGRTPRVSKCLFLKCSAANVPKVGCVR